MFALCISIGPALCGGGGNGGGNGNGGVLTFSKQTIYFIASSTLKLINSMT